MKKQNKIYKICFITNSRSEYGLMKWLMNDFKSHNSFKILIFVGGPHLVKNFGYTYKEILKDGFRITKFCNKKIEKISNKSDWAETLCELTVNYLNGLKKHQPDCIFFMGDRIENMALLSASSLLNIPLAHISGGEITEGAVDDQIRHASTKMSHMHFVANKEYYNRVTQLGEEKWRICISGEPGLDSFKRVKLYTVDELSKSVGLNLNETTALVTFHSVTMELSKLSYYLEELIKAIDKINIQYLVTYPSPDPGSAQIIKTFEDYSKYKKNMVFVKSLGQTKYLSALYHCKLMLGNSSSGLVESAIPNIPVVNIGNRQKGRVKGENVFDVSYNHKDIIRGINKSLLYDRSKKCKSLYGNGNASNKIIKFTLKTLDNFNNEKILTKKFIDK